MDRIKFSAEIPPKVLEAQSELKQYLDYDFVIASMYLDSEVYRNYYLMNKRPGTILDNGAFETGASIDTKVYLRVIEELQPSIVVIPDVQHDCEQTLFRANEFFTQLPPGFDMSCLMGALQGSSVQDFEDLLEKYVRNGVQLIGIPYGVIDRVNFIQQHPEVKFHALGLQYFPELLSLRLLKNVVSIDTSLPVKFATNQKFLYELFPLTIKERPDFEKGFDIFQGSCLRWNLKFIWRICDRTNKFFVYHQSEED